MGKIIDIKIMNLSARVERVLLRHGIKTANDLFQHANKDYLLSLRGFGPKSLDEVEQSILMLMNKDKFMYFYLENLPRIYNEKHIKL